jgi:glutaconyl-CoA/methylmalonyl-CoA decarboxylase subunit gamma
MSTYRLRIGETEYEAEVKSITPHKACIVVNGTEYVVDLVSIGRQPAEPSRPAAPPRAAPEAKIPPRQVRSTSEGTAGSVRSPMPGLVLRIEVREGQTVKAGQTLLVMEAMKMENTVLAPHNGTVRKILAIEGASVSEGDVLVEVARPEMTTL